MAEEKKERSLTTIIIFVLALIVAFLIGMFVMRFLGQGGEGKKEIAQASPAPQAAQEQGEVLGEEQIKKIESGGAAVKGEENAPVTIVEFSEYQCPYCGKYVMESYPQILEEYGDQIRYIFHDFPLQFHAHAQKMAEAARCAGDQGQYWQMHNLIFENQEEWSGKESVDADIDNFVSQLNLLNKAEFDTCLDSGKYTQVIETDRDLGLEVGVQGTPTFFINGQMLVGAVPFSNFKTIIEAELAK
ncbi:MAG TPA: DsbA family protein [Patescibacteria group bacterium]|nr:DsbA family protein [Patescibacteria group bacterium]